MSTEDFKELFQDTEWKKELTAIIDASVEKQLKNHPLQCRFTGISDNDARVIGQYVGILSERSEHNLAVFFDSVFENHKWLEKQRKRGSKITLAVLLFAVIAATSGALDVFTAGFKTLFGLKP